MLAHLLVLAPRSLFSKHTTESVGATDHHHEPLCDQRRFQRFDVPGVLGVWRCELGNPCIYEDVLMLTCSSWDTLSMGSSRRLGST